MYLLRLVPNRIICRELKLLYKSNRLVEFFESNIYTHSGKKNSMALNKFERMFVSWAVKQHHKTTERERLKQEMIEYAITGTTNSERREDTEKVKGTKVGPISKNVSQSLSNVALFGMEHASEPPNKEENN